MWGAYSYGSVLIIATSILSSPQHTSMWFIGLEFKKTPGGVNIEITFEIQAFINAGQWSHTNAPPLLPTADACLVSCSVGH